MNSWKHQPETWMQKQSPQMVNDIDNPQAYHQALKSKCSTMLFELFGNKTLVELLIRFPIRSVEQFALLPKSFVEAWQNYRNTPENSQAQENSQKNDTGEARLIYNLRQRQKRAKWIASWVTEDWNNWYQLNQANQTLWSEHNDGTIRRQIADQQTRQHPRFPGAAEQLAARAHFHEHI